MAMPMPSTVAPASPTSSMRPFSAHPFARKSSMISTWSSAFRNFFDTMTSYTRPCVNDSMRVVNISPSRLML